MMKKLYGWLATLALSALLLSIGAVAFAAEAPPRAMPSFGRKAAVSKAAARVAITPVAASVNAGATLQLKATVNGATGRNILWRVERGADVGTVDQNGLVTGIKPGNVSIRAMDVLTGQSLVRKVVVKAVRVTRVTLEKTSMVLEIGEAYDMPAPTITPANATVTATKWTTSNKNVAVVDGNGRITPLAAGIARITCAVGSKLATCQVRVRGQSVAITLSAAGDVILGGDPTVTGALVRSTEATFKQLIDQHGSVYPFKNVANVFRSDDVSIVNLEGTLTTAQSMNKKPHTFRGDPSYAKMLTDAGIEVCNLANNHSRDFKERGLLDTRRSLDSAGVKWCDFTENGTYTVKKGGMDVKIGFAGFQTPVLSSAIQARVKALKKKCDVVVVSFHWCDTKEWTAQNYNSDRARAKTAINAGADLVLGHHRHVPAGIEMYNGKYIVFDLSNFIVGIKHKAENGRPLTDSMIFQWTFRIDTRGVVENEDIKVIPCTTTTSTELYPADDEFGNIGAPVNNFQPAILSGAAAEAVLGRIRGMSTVPIG